MAKIIIMQGLPASGKSTRAKELMEHGNTVRLNKDLLRTMLHFNNFTGQNEGKTKDAERYLARYFLEKDINVIVDDTNLNPRVIDSWKGLAKELDAKIQYERIITPIHECLRRDGLREKTVGKHVIINMAMQYGLDDLPVKGYILCDLDGTLCDIKQRLSHVKKTPKDWKSFFDGICNDTINVEVEELLRKYSSEGYRIVLVTARPDTYKSQTLLWLMEHLSVDFYTLIMRRSSDKRIDEEVKGDMLDVYFSTEERKKLIYAVIDDRPRVIRMWRGKGFEVIDVGEGIEF